MTALLIHILFISAIFIGFFLKLQRKSDRMVFSTFTLLKIACGILMGLLYFSYYEGTGDTIYFYEQAQLLYQHFQSHEISWSQWIGISPLGISPTEFSAQNEPRTYFFVRVISFLYAFTQGDYFILSVYLSLFSGLATWVFAKELGKFSKQNQAVVYIALLFIPSVTFWSSGLLKESLMVFAIYTFGLSILKWMAKPHRWFYAFISILSIYILWKVKYYVPITLLPIVFLTLFFYKDGFLKQFGFTPKLLVYLTLLIASGLIVAFIHPVFYSGRFFELIRISHDVIVANSTNSMIHFYNAEGDKLFFMLNLPLAWFTGIFRPFVWEAFSTFSFIWAIEKTIFTLLTIFALMVSFKVKFTQAEKWWGVAILIYVSSLASVITLASPNFGTLIRYEVAYMPFLWLLVLFILNKYKLNLK